MNIKLLLIGLVTLLLVSCETKEWKQSDISLVPVYQIDYVVGDVALEVYKQKPLLLEYTNISLVSSFEMENYMDASSDSLYAITFTRMDSLIIDSVNTEVVKMFDISASIRTDTGMLNIMYLNGSDTILSTDFDITIKDTEVYN